MSIIGDFWKAIQNKMLGSGEYTITSEDLKGFINRDEWNRLAIYDFALHSGINIIAYALSKCEFRTFMRGQERKEAEYYLWNFSPNPNQNASQFIQKLVWALIYRNECLIVETRQGDLYIADRYVRKSNGISEDTFENVRIFPDEGANGDVFEFPRPFRASDVMYFKLSNKNISRLLNQLVGEYNQLLEGAIQNFFRSTGERGILNIQAKATTATYGIKADGTPRTFNDVYSEMINDSFKDYFKSQNAVMPLWEGFAYEPKSANGTRKSTSEVKDITDLTSEIYAKVANALQIPPALLKGDVSQVDQITDNLITFAIDPYAKMIEREANRKRNGTRVLKGTYLMVDTSTVKHIDIFNISTQADKLIACGGWSIDEIRQKAGDSPLDTDWSTEHWMTLNYARIENAMERTYSNSENAVSGTSTEGGEEGSAAAEDRADELTEKKQQDPDRRGISKHQERRKKRYG